MRYKTNIILAILALFLASCGSQRKLALEFFREYQDVHVLVLPSLGVLKKYYPVDPDSPLPEDFDPFSLETSQFIKDADDSLLLNLFMTSLGEELEALGVKVYSPANLEEFLLLDSSAYVFSLAQLEVMEYLRRDVRQAILDTIVYEVAFDQVNLVHSQWFEFTELNHPERPMEVLFSAQHTGDIFEGRFRHNIFSGEMCYEFQPYRISIEDLYQLSHFAGKKNAQFILDFLLNKFVDERIGKSRKMVDYLHYDRERHAIRRAYDDRFIRIRQSLDD